MNDSINIGEIICNGITELLHKNRSQSVQNTDFTKVWCNLCLLPAYRVEYVIQTSLHTQKGYNKNEAVIYGHLMRIYKMLCLQRRLVAKRVMTTTLSSFFERIILEGNINLQYFIYNYQESPLDAFRINSLKPEAFFEEAILHDIEASDGKASDWQTGLLASIRNTYFKTGSMYEDVKKNRCRLPSISEKFSSTDNQRLYDTAYRMKCHDIHGDWVDFTQNYLNYNIESNTFTPDFEEHEADLRQLNPLLLICGETLKKFIKNFQGHGIPDDLCDEIIKDQQLIFFFEDMHMNYLKKRDLLYEIENPLFQ